MEKNVLIAGESWMSFTTHVKGCDSFVTSVYEEGVEHLEKALIEGGYHVDFMPNHIASNEFPSDMANLKKYNCIVLSDRRLYVVFGY